VTISRHRQGATASRLLAVEPFSVRGAGGGPRIMRSLLNDAPAAVLAVATSPSRLAEAEGYYDVPEIQLPVRPHFGRLEHTRAIRGLGVLDMALLARLAHRLAHIARGGTSEPSRRTRATWLHGLSHSLDFVAVQRVATGLQLPMFLSVHDDPGYVLRGRIERPYALRRLGDAWAGSRQRFVISEEMGMEMCRRYGERSYLVVTDGLEKVALSPRPRVVGRLSVYFMGATHIAYADNFQCLLNALAQLRDEGVDASLVTRAGHRPFKLKSMGVPIDERPWAQQTDVLRDFDDVDIAYMPLPFGRSHDEFVRFSMSTKMVTYVGSGLPVLFHGPRASAAAHLLGQADAAFIADSLDVRAVAETLRFGADCGLAIAGHALRLARRRFLLSDIRLRFWQPILEST
jgi:hypothetical protein